MARNVGDLALLLSVLAGPDPRAPQALGEPGSAFAPPVSGSLAGLRVALSVDLGGAFEVDHEVAAVVASSASVLTGAGASVADAHPDLGPADDTFRTLRAWHFQAKFGRLLAEHPDSFKPSLADNIRAGESLTGADVARGYAQRTALAETMREFFAGVDGPAYDVLVLPVSQVPPFPADQEFPTAINGRPMESYLDWMRSAYFITVTGCPAISVPCGRTSDGLPVGVQIVAPHGRDRFLLEVAAAFEEAVGEVPAGLTGSSVPAAVGACATGDSRLPGAAGERRAVGGLPACLGRAAALVDQPSTTNRVTGSGRGGRGMAGPRRCPLQAPGPRARATRPRATRTRATRRG